MYIIHMCGHTHWQYTKKENNIYIYVFFFSIGNKYLNVNKWV